MHDTDLRRLLLARCPPLASLPPPLLARVLDEGRLHAAADGAILFDAQTPCEGFPLVLEGSVRVAKASPGGREIVLYRVTPGEGCVLSGGCLPDRADHGARGTAEGEVLLLRLPPPLFQALMTASEPFRRFVFEMVGARLAEVMELVEAVAFRQLDHRLARLLVQHGPTLATTHQALADELGSTRVVVSRLLRSFEERGWLRLERERVTLTDAAALAVFART